MATATAPNGNRAGATNTKEPSRSSDFDEFMKRSVKFTPLAEVEQIEVSVGMVKNVLAVRSKSGKEPEASDIMKFMMLCKSRKLNPFVGDAYLLGYDSKDGTKWNLITAIQALRKRAEGNPKYRGTECGVIVRGADGSRIEREGAMVDDGEKVVGGWCKVHREDRTIPAYASVKFSVYDTGYSRWAKDPGGMIAKVAEAAALRQAFPSDLAGLYIRDEFDSGEFASVPQTTTTLTAPPKVRPSKLNDEPRNDHGGEDSGAIDQRDDESGDGIDPPSGDYGNQDETSGDPQGMTKAELEEQASGRTRQKSAFDTSSQVGQ